MMGRGEQSRRQMSLRKHGFFHAGGEAAVASLLAHYPRQLGSLGQ